MRRNQELDIDHAHHAAKIIVNLRKLLQIIDLRKGECITQISDVIDSMETHLAKTAESNELNVWQLVLMGLRVLGSHLHCRNIALNKSGDLLSERERLAILCAEFQSYLSDSVSQGTNNHKVINEVIGQDGRSINPGRLLLFLQSIPLPITYWKHKRDHFPFSPESLSADEENNLLPSPLVRIIAFIDNAPLVTPQLLQPKLIYSLKFRIRGITWHKDAERLRLDLLTTYPSSDYSISNFALQQPECIEDNEYEGELTGQIKFISAQSLLSEDITFIVRCAFELVDGSFHEVAVIGHNQIDFRIVEPQGYGFSSGRPSLDKHVAQLLESLLKDSPSVRDELPELFSVLDALTRLLGTYAQGSVFKDNLSISEAEFQLTIVRDLRFILGQDVEEHPSQAGGITDIRYRGIIIELKVEKTNGNRQQICEKYTRQSTQYESVEARQISVVLILDITPKNNPPGDIRNDILLVDVPTHGGDDLTKKYPSKAFVFVVNGNIKKPSDYSRR
ncbi:hypothetical protein IQ276_036415 [Desmonostoc muscorum LEGE 12446]|uniref:Uncharacterized protein n=1 Tax=Desmonostoc muscorum LEGE 12446 TaxID=1828758 RepID=A0A8J7AEP1_DESMC|nr:hypothetical protein [Desmonostoc muscorum]MCF2151804.1 hypothetical protein [Desmonostoc muscorum LEGE 12446]